MVKKIEHIVYYWGGVSDRSGFDVRSIGRLPPGSGCLPSLLASCGVLGKAGISGAIHRTSRLPLSTGGAAERGGRRSAPIHVGRVCSFAGMPFHFLRRILCLVLVVAFSHAAAKGARLDSFKLRWKTGEGEIFSHCHSMTCVETILGRSVLLRCARGQDSCAVRGAEGIYAWACTDRSSGVDSLEDLSPALQLPIRERMRIEDSAVAWEDARYRTCSDLGQDTVYTYEQVWANGRVERVRLSKSHFDVIEPPGAGHPGWVFHLKDMDMNIGYVENPSPLYFLRDPEDVFTSWATPGWSDDKESSKGRWDTGVPLRVLQEIPFFPGKGDPSRWGARSKAASRKDSLETHCEGAVTIAAGRLSGPLRLDAFRSELLKLLRDRRAGETLRLRLPNEQRILVALRGHGAWLEYNGRRLRPGQFPDPEWNEKHAFDKCRAPLRYYLYWPYELVILPGARTLTFVGKDVYGFMDTVTVKLPAGHKP